VYADLSTGSPTVMRRLHAAFKEKGVHVLDAPVSGGVRGAERGSLQVMVGGDEGIYREVKTVLQAVGDKVGYMGPIGAGTIAKLVHNTISLSTRALVAEGFTLGVKAGVKPEALLEALRGASFGQGLILSEVIPNVVFTGDFDRVRFALRLARKDVGLATELAREYDVPMPLAAVVEQIMMEAVARGWGDRDSTAPWLLQEEAAGVQVRATT
jgi:3-hydroxyisobutyrate dehydrogenase